MSEPPAVPENQTLGERSLAVQQSEDFQRLRRSFLRFIVPLTVLFLAWYLLYVLLASFAHDFFAQKLFGNITVGLAFGIGQVVTTFAITMLYRWWADRRYDPHAEAIRREMESGEILDDASGSGSAGGAISTDDAEGDQL